MKPEGDWRARLIEIIAQHFKPEDAAHGLEHALEVEDAVNVIAREPEFEGITIDMPVLQAASLLHDIGYSKLDSTWSSDRGEHIRHSVNIAREMLSHLSPFAEDQFKIDEICYLVLNHDATNFSFPIKTRGGQTFNPTLPLGTNEGPERFGNQVEKLQTMLLILKEADSRSGIGKDGERRTLDYSLGRRVSPFAQGSRLSAWMWEESAVGNVRLSAKRAILDAHTKHGQEIALHGYWEAERVIEGFCKNSGVTYEEEMFGQSYHPPRPPVKSPEIEFTDYVPWHGLVEIIRRAKLRGDSLLFPYAAATIETQLVDFDRLSPLSHYYLLGQIDFHRRLRDHFLSDYALDLLDLAGIVGFHIAQEEKHDVISPPIVEVYEEDEGDITGEVWALVDGIHRCVLARQLGITRLRVVVIRNVPKHLPLVPMPLRWSEVTGVESITNEEGKRKYRFPSLASFPDISGFSSEKPTERTCPYFFYRDLRDLGSSGIRPVSKKD